MTRAKQDLHFMRRALELARRGEGRTRPNPPVGAVVVRQGRVLGEGWHRQAGMPHAEVEAIRACRGSVKGATIYVTLEPCCTHGRTPPCTDLLIRSGIVRVVVGCVDPNPRHASRGFRILHEAGIRVTTGVLAEECCRLVEPFAMNMREERPFVTLKLALTLDGRIADRSGSSKWITGPEARDAVQALRGRVDAVMVGAGTVLADDPSLRCRLPNAHDLLRVIVDGAGRTPARAQVLTDRWAESTLMVTTARCPADIRKRWSRNGARVWALPAGVSDRIPLRTLLHRLGDEGILHVLCEGGSRLAGALVRAGLVDEYLFFYAPAVMGDERGIGAVAESGFRLATMPRLRIAEVTRIGADVLVRARPQLCPPCNVPGRGVAQKG
jgi:diaminohydroxyphosphoribosylaminopyrimidine deaminase/5-amino-6-(5-phosphoribosylamino)uracil reductase